ncbi:uncharacterized protein LOC133528521 [Cydia pomonella]|uniref:uncharacterized protein LOC133528521 n=1 Tax=Cydia pomonella TaxID=82600 RepID=UPI002ADD5FB4|nr:uncharacterized protein LOC133528521 [Cydia pomonella]
MDFPNTSGIRSPFSPRVRQSISGRRAGLSSAKKSQSKFMQSIEAPTGEVIYKTPLTTVETYGHPLPVLVTEALTFASGEVTVGLSANGYCWLVFGRRLLVWARDGGAARELTLPQTDLQHKAELVEVFYEDGAQMPSCIGVSPEGVARYWPSVGQELYADTSCELAGQECSRLLASGSAAALLLATTSCSLLQLRPEPERTGVTCRQLRPPSGWLGGIGRRVSLLFFGSMPANADTKLVGVVILLDGPMCAGEQPGYVALVGGGGGAVLQLWRGAELHEHNLRRALTDAHRAQGDVITCGRAAGPRGAGGRRRRRRAAAVARRRAARAQPAPRAHRRAQGSRWLKVTSLLAGEQPGHVALVGGGGGAVLQLWRGAELHEHNLRRALTDAHRAQGLKVTSLLAGEQPGHVALVGGGGGAVLQLWRGAELHEHNLRRALTDAHRAQGLKVTSLLAGEQPGHVALVGGGGGAVLQLWRGAELHEHNLRRALTDAHRAQGLKVTSLLAGEQPGHVALVGGGGGAVLQLWRGAELHEHNLRRALTDAHRAQGLKVTSLLAGEQPGHVALVGGGGGAVLQLWRGAELHEHNLRRALTDASRATWRWWAAAAAPCCSCGAAPSCTSTTCAARSPTRTGLKVTSLLAGEQPGHVALVGGGGGAVLQLWRGAELHEHNLRRALTDAHRAQGDVNSLQVMCLDVRAGGPQSLALLIACVNVARSDTRHAIAHMSVEDPANPRVTSLIPLRGCTLSPDIAPRLLPLPSAAALYTSTYVAIVSTVANDKVEYIDVASEGDRILGATLCNGQPLLFSRKHGVLALTSAETVSTNVSVCESPMGSPCPSDMYDGNLSLYEIDPHEVSMVTTDACGKLKTAFLFHLRRDAAACRAIVQELFPAKQRADPALDNTVVRIATELCDDVPQGDPRWKQRAGALATNIPLGSSSALQINAQLRDKQRAFSLFADFLRATGLWQRLGSVALETGGDCISTVSALGMLAEKLAIALALRKKQQSGDSQLIDAAVYQVVCGDEAEPEEPEVEAALSSGALSPADVCFRRVSGVQRALAALCAVGAPAQHDARALAAHAQQVSRLLTSILTEVHGTCAQWPARPPRLGAGALLPRLLQLHTRAVAQYGPGCPDVVLRSSLYEATSLLADLILTEAESLRQHSDTRHVGDKMRRDIIQPYIDAGQMERAAVLAEKFKDFELLIEMCDRQDDMERLYSYIDKYSGEGIAESAFAYLMERGGGGTARLLRALGARYPARLRAWLARTPARDPARALHLLSAKDYGQAARVLAQLARGERDSVSRLTVSIQSVPDGARRRHGAAAARARRPLPRAPARLARQDPGPGPGPRAAPAQRQGLRASGSSAGPAGQGGAGLGQQADAARLLRALGARYPARLRAWLARTPARDPARALHLLSAKDYGQAARVLAQLARGERDSRGGGTARLLRALGARYPARLRAWLARTPARDPARALHLLSAKDYGQAARVLAQLARGERDSRGGGTARLLRALGARYPARLRAWLARTPARDPARALHLLSAKDYGQAARVLAQLARGERDSRGGGTARLLRALGARYPARLRAWLARTPARDPARALHLLSAKDYGQAARVLAQLARGERDSRGGGTARLLRALGARYPARLRAWLARTPARDPARALHLLSAKDYGQAARVLAQLARGERDSRGGGTARLLRALGARYPARLRAWLARTPARDPARALHLLSAKDYGQAARVLAQLARGERDSRGGGTARLLRALGARYPARLRAWLARTPARDPARALHLLSAKDYGLYLTERGGGTARLLRALGARYPARLRAWLARTPARDPARALHLLSAKDYGQAARVLAQLARGERDSVSRLTTTASLAKLCLLASDEETQPSDLWNKVEGCLSLAEQHAALPRDIKLLHGLDAADCNVMPPEELVQMYIESESDALTEYDYKKALDLTDFVQDMERRDDLRLRVWCACIRRSSWAAVDVEAPAAELQDKMVFRLMHLVHFMGGDLELLLPPAEDVLTARELADLVSDARFRYIIKYGYECLHGRRHDRPPQQETAMITT